MIKFSKYSYERTAGYIYPGIRLKIMAYENFKNAIKVPNLNIIRKLRMHEDFRVMLDHMALKFGEDSAFIIKTKHETDSSPAEYKHVSFTGLRRDVIDTGTEFMNMGLKGKRLAIIGKNRYEWMLGYYAHLCGLGIVVPLDKGLPYEELELSLQNSHSDVLLFDRDHLEFVETLIRTNRTEVKLFICMDAIEGFPNLPAIISRGRHASDEEKNKYRHLPLDGKEMSIILFTSGTSGLAKAVMLSQYNICYNIWQVLSTEDLRHGDVNMAFLPYHHTFGSTGQTMMSCCGMTTVYCDGLKYIQKNLKEYRVSVFICVPLIIESMYKKILHGVKKQGMEARFAAGRKISKALHRLHIDVRRRLFKDVLEQLGGGIRYVISGASPLDPEVSRGFKDMGVEVIQGYGLTETSPVLAAENPQHRRDGSIGRAIPGQELLIINADEEGVGELIASGDNLMSGYYENEEATGEVMEYDENGRLWFHTGDLARLDADGYLYISGRKKNVIVLKNGKNIYPEELETLIANLPYVRENMVFGQKKHRDGPEDDLTISVRIVYDPEYMQTIYGARTPEAIDTIISRDLEILNEGLPTYKHIYRHELTDIPMEMTTTGKIKRYKELNK